MGACGYTNGYQDQNSTQTYGAYYNTTCYNGSLSNYTNGYGSVFNGSSNTYNSSLNGAVSDQLNYANNSKNHYFNAPPHSGQPALPKSSTQTEQPAPHESTQTGALEQPSVALGTSQTARSLTPTHGTPTQPISPRPFTPTLLIGSHTSQDADGED
jgi:hypothetical protein